MPRHPSSMQLPPPITKTPRDSGIVVGSQPYLSVRSIYIQLSQVITCIASNSTSPTIPTTESLLYMHEPKLNGTRTCIPFIEPNHPPNHPSIPATQPTNTASNAHLFKSPPTLTECKAPYALVHIMCTCRSQPVEHDASCHAFPTRHRKQASPPHQSCASCTAHALLCAKSRALVRSDACSPRNRVRHLPTTPEHTRGKSHDVGAMTARRKRHARHGQASLAVALRATKGASGSAIPNIPAASQVPHSHPHLRRLLHRRKISTRQVDTPQAISRPVFVPRQSCLISQLSTHLISYLPPTMDGSFTTTSHDMRPIFVLLTKCIFSPSP
jgi:hypothetical protein